MGYYDDGEEHLGVNDDEYDRKFYSMLITIQLTTNIYLDILDDYLNIVLLIIHDIIFIYLYTDKKRLKEISEDADSKLAKKARRLADAVGSQKNSILNFVRPGTSTIQHVEKSKAMSSELKHLYIFIY